MHVNVNGGLGLTLGLASLACAGVSVYNQPSERALNAPPSLSIALPNLTSKWFEGSTSIQIIELLIKNTDSTYALTTDDGLNVTASGPSVNLAKASTIKRLLPGQSALVQVGVANKAGVAAGTFCNVTITAQWGHLYGQSRTTAANVDGKCGVGDFTANATSLDGHQTPDWFNNAKFGIFIHWGIYSVPAYGSQAPNEDYAEWYWKWQHDPNHRTHTYQYHLDTYGQNLNYDDFIGNFTASKFNARSWLDLIAASGARYFVPVTKHHDGFAIFDVPAETSMRSSINFGPKRDFLKELFTAAKTYYPQLRRGTYFSMPEWYHPGYKKYAITWGGGFPGGPPINPYTRETIPYTGYVPVNDYVQDLQYPQMKTLAYTYETEIMWCDIGGANNSPQMLSDWINWAKDQGRQVVFNSRCGITGDFDTPEYTTYPDTVMKKWESSRGMDPYSYGYNHKTPDSEYLTGGQIVNSLVDIVSKNGNFLLDIGPKSDGTIPQIMQKGLLDAGAWIIAYAESIFDTHFWYTTAGTGDLRYTTTPDAFYIHILSKPSANRFTIPDKVPYLNGDVVSVVGGSMNGVMVPVTLDNNNQFTLIISDAMIAADKYVWTFKITYGTGR